jgi:predicted nucleic acid-binding Zn ribbon protein
MKKCPFCAEEIQDEAVKCKHCGEFLIEAELKKDAGLEWYYRTPLVVLWILLLGPFALPFILRNPQYDTKRKTIWTVVTIIFTVLAILLIVAFVIFYFWFMGHIANFGL